MNDEEFRAFLSFVFDTYVRPRVHTALHYLGPMGERFGYDIDRMRRAAQLARFIQAFSDNDDDVYSTLRGDRIANTVDDVGNVVSNSVRVLDETGFLDALNAHYDEILEGLSVEHMPPSELSLLRELGSDDPQRDLRAVIFIMRARRNKRFQADRTRVEQDLSRVAKELSEAAQQIQKAAQTMQGLADVPPHARKPRRWFKGLGQIAQGMAVSLANVGLALAWLHFPVSPETQTWGSLVSVTTGIGMAAAGAGDLRGE
jgi:hypothetical protein